MASWKSGEAVKVVEVIERTRETEFVSLHHHSTFSYLDGYGTPEDHVNRAAELGMNAIALTEHGNVSSHVRLEQAAKGQGIKPIFGCELYCGEVDEERRSRRKNHLTVLAENEEGYRNLLRVVSRGWAEGYFHEPTVSGSMLRDHREGLIVLSGCSGSLLATSLIGGKNIDPKDASYKRAKRQAERFKHVLGDGFYIEVQAFPELEKTRDINAGFARLSAETGIPLVATLDAHYPHPEQGEIQAILHNLRPGKRQTYEDQLRSWGYDVPLTHVADEELMKRLIGTGLSRLQASQAIGNARLIADRCNVTLPKVENLRFPLPSGVDDNVTLFRKWINDGWRMRGFNRLSGADRERYVERVKYEMDLIVQKGFVDYFLVVSDIVRWAKDNGVAVGPARGSAAASLVCYLMRITEIDPMLFPTLLFERFIDLNRHDLPDIDLDFDDELRYKVRDRLAEIYGDERVGNIGTFTKFKGRNSLDDVAKVFGVPKWEIDDVKKMLIVRSPGDLRAGSTIEDSIEMFPKVKEVFDRYPDLYKSRLLEGNVKGMSVHAAGLVIANGPLSDFCAIYTRIDERTGEVNSVVSLDKHDAEYLNVLKLDALGLKTMALIRIALEQIGMSLADLYATPLDLDDVIQGFRDGDVVGVFQFDGQAMRNVNKGVCPDNFMEVADVNALARPGPLHSGATAEYIDVKHGKKDPVHYHPIIDEITKHTNYQVVYQEQILQVVRHLGMFSWEEAARIRKIISKKRGEQEFNQQRDKFVDGAATHGMSPEDANRVFSMLATAGAYAFNAAHCVSYGMLAYWTMFLKRRYPREFFVAALRKYDEDKMKDLLMDLDRFDRNIRLLPLDVNVAGTTWSAADGGIMPGFLQVKGIGPSTAPAIVAKRAELGGFNSVSDLGKVRGVGPGTVAKVKDFIGREDAFGIHVLGERLEAMRAELRKGIPMDEKGFFMLPEPTHTAAEVPGDRTPSNVPVVWLGVVKSRNLKDLFESHHSKTGQHLDPASVKDPHRKEWVVIYGEDDTDIMTVTIDRWKYSRFKDMVWSIVPGEELVLFKGYKMGVQARRAIYVTDMWILDDSEEE